MTAVMTGRYNRFKKLLDETLEMYDKYEAITGEAPKKITMDPGRNEDIARFIQKNITLNKRGIVVELWGIPVEDTEWKWERPIFAEDGRYKYYTKALLVK